MQLAPKGKKPPQKEEVLPEQNAYQQLKAGQHKAKEAKPVAAPAAEFIPAPAEGIKPQKGKKYKKILAPKKKVTDAGGDWEVVDKRDAFLIERPAVTDSDEAESDLSSD